MQEEMSDKKTIVLVHGMMVGPWCWDKYKSFFEEQGYYCVVPTLRYHEDEYQKVPHEKMGETSLRQYVDDLEEQIKRLSLPEGEKPIIVGHSMGGIIVQMLAERGLAEMIVTISSAPPRGILPISFTGIKSSFWIRSRGGLDFWNRSIKATFKGMQYMGLHLTPKEEHKTVFEKMGFESGRAAFEIAFSFLDSKKVSRVNEKNVDVPMLVIAASEDRILPPSVQKKIAKKYNAAYKEFTKHAHWIIAEPNWEEVAKYILNWIQKSMR